MKKLFWFCVCQAGVLMVMYSIVPAWQTGEWFKPMLGVGLVIIGYMGYMGRF